MDILEVKEILLRWIKSCDKVEQLDGLEKSIPELLNNLFSSDKEVSIITLTITRDFLLGDIKDQKEIIKQ